VIGFVCVIMSAFLRFLHAGMHVVGEVHQLPMTNDDLVTELRKSFSSEEVLEAFSKVDRGNFCVSPNPSLKGCYIDMPYRDELVHLSAPIIYGKLLLLLSVLSYIS
jgi:hypothetical protein